MAILAKNHLSEVIGLKNDIVHKVFSCPNCKTEVTVSRYQVQGELQIVCARCNMRFQIKGEELVDIGETQGFVGYKVFVKGDAAQMAQPVPKDSYGAFVKAGMKWAPAVAPKPAAAPGAAPAAPAAPAAAPKPAEGTA
jgi:DNA-directed RNA polymerase subunit RPC12/RpoP